MTLLPVNRSATSMVAVLERLHRDRTTGVELSSPL